MNVDPLLPDNATDPSSGSKPRGQQLRRAVLYCDPTMPEAARLRDFLKRRGVGLEERDVTQNAGWAEHVIRSGGNPLAPFTEFEGGERFTGFDDAVKSRMLKTLD